MVLNSACLTGSIVGSLSLEGAWWPLTACAPRAVGPLSGKTKAQHLKFPVDIECHRPLVPKIALKVTVRNCRAGDLEFAWDMTAKEVGSRGKFHWNPSRMLVLGRCTVPLVLDYQPSLADWAFDLWDGPNLYRCLVGLWMEPLDLDESSTLSTLL